jgi:hypothetical protein
MFSGALPWVIPALDPKTPVYAGSFVMQLVARRLQEYNLYNPDRSVQWLHYAMSMCMAYGFIFMGNVQYNIVDHCQG